MSRKNRERNQSKVAIAPQEGAIVDNMRKKYGPNCLDMWLDVWVEKYKFPTGESLGRDELRKLECRLKIEEERVAND